MVALKLQRVGRHNSPHFRLIAIDKLRDPQARAKEVLGHWHPVLLFEAIENHTKLFNYEVPDLLDLIASYAYTLYRIVDGTLERATGTAQNGNYLALPQRKTYEKKR